MELGNCRGIAGQAQHIWTHHFPGNTAIECLLQPAVQRPLEFTRISYSKTKIPAALCLPLWQRSWRNLLEVQTQAPPLPGAMWIWWVLPLNWTYRDEDMGGTVAAISRRRGGEPCLPFGVCLFFFPLLHSNLVWCHMISHIWGKYHCFNFRKYIVQIHVPTRSSRVACCMKRKKRNSCQADTSTHLFFVHLFSHDLSPRRYLLHLGFFKDMEIKFPERKISTRRKESLLRGWFL